MKPFFHILYLSLLLNVPLVADAGGGFSEDQDDLDNPDTRGTKRIGCLVVKQQLLTKSIALCPSATPGTPGVPGIGGDLAYGSFYDSRTNITYNNNALIAFGSPTVSPVGLSVDSTGTLFTLSNPGIYKISFVVRSTPATTGTSSTMQILLNGSPVTGTQFESTTATTSSAIGIVLIQVPTANSVVSIQNISGQTVTVPTGVDNVLNIERIA